MTKNNSAAPSGLADFLHARGAPSLFSSRFQVLLPSRATLVGLSSSSALVEVFHPKKSCYDPTPCFVSGTCLYTASIVQSESFQPRDPFLLSTLRSIQIWTFAVSFRTENADLFLRAKEHFRSSWSYECESDSTSKSDCLETKASSCIIVSSPDGIKRRRC